MDSPSEHPPADPHSSTPPAELPAVPHDSACKSCGYALTGLRADGLCPECGYPVEKSLLDNALANSSPEYLESLHKGVSMITIGILVMVAMTLLGFGLVAVAAAAATVSQSLLNGTQLLLSGISTLISFVILYGWWRFTEPDPAFTGREDGSKARKVLRIAVVASAATAVLSLIFEFASLSVVTPAPNMPITTGMSVVLALAAIAGLVALIAFAVQFFAAMLYVRWVAPRIPDPWVYKRAKTLMWLGPVLYVPGALLCGLGPLIALVLYWNMLDRVRKDIKAVRQHESRAAPA